MAKFKVYELAKELDKQSKEVISFLQEKGIEVKAAQSSVDDEAAALVRKHFGTSQAVKPQEVKQEASAKVQEEGAAVVKEAAPKTEPVKVQQEEAKEEEHPKKKKNIIFVSNPQNSKMPGGTKSPMNNKKAKPAKPAQEVKQEPKQAPVPKPIQLGPNQMINKSTGKVMEMLPPKKPEVVEKEKPVVTEEKPAAKPNRDMGFNKNNTAPNKYNERNGERNNERPYQGRNQSDEQKTG